MAKLHSVGMKAFEMGWSEPKAFQRSKALDRKGFGQYLLLFILYL